MRRPRTSNQYGGVSIFIVVFTALLVTVVVSSFAQLMMRNQQQAQANDLSQSAYDSAIAGVEDAKRALVRLAECDKTGSSCANDIRNAFSDLQGCDALQVAGVVRFDIGKQEVKVGDADQNQAYTCVKVQLDTPDYQDDGLAPGVPVVVPLKSESNFDTVRLSWFTKADLDKISGESGVETVALPSGTVNLVDTDDWPKYAPGLMRTQLIQFTQGSINLDEFNQKGTPNARTLFLYPRNYSTSVPLQVDFNNDVRRQDTTTNNLAQASCNDTFTEFNGYACQVDLKLPTVAGAREAYLQLQTYYQQFSSYKLELLEGSTPVNLKEVQPLIDSTGRASSQFRRVEARVTLRNDAINLQYPDAALSVDGDLCKNFFVTNSATNYDSRCIDSEDTP